MADPLTVFARAVLGPSESPRTAAAQDASWEKYHENHYMRMIEGYAFATSLERELAERDRRFAALMKRCREDQHTPTYADLLALKADA